METTTSRSSSVVEPMEGWVLLPEELLIYVFSFLSVKDVLRLSLVNKRWKRLADEEYLWKGLCSAQWGLVPEVNAEFACWGSWKKSYKSLVYLNDIAPRLKTKSDPEECFYRCFIAPEILLGGEWHEGSDMWAAGAIMGELYFGDMLFYAPSEASVLRRIMAVIGPPTEEDIESMGLCYTNCVDYFKQGFGSVRTSLEEVLPTMSPDGIDLLKQILVWNPTKRLPAWKALHHPYMSFIRTLPEGAGISEARHRQPRNYEKTREALRELLKVNSKSSPSSSTPQSRRRASKKVASIFASQNSSSSTARNSSKNHTKNKPNNATTSHENPASTKPELKTSSKKTFKSKK